MKTSKPIATISYNSNAFLCNRILELRRKGLIDYAMWILHQPDVDGTKPHYHVYIEPAKMVQTEELVKLFIEPVPKENPDDAVEPDPLGVMVFRNSKATDWLLYALHNEKYLTDKGLARNLSYEVGDVQRTCDYTFADIVSQAFDQLNNRLEQRLIEAVYIRHMKWFEIVKSGMIPINKMSGALIMYRALTGQTDIDCEPKEE